MGSDGVLLCSETPEGEILYISDLIYLYDDSEHYDLHVWRPDAGVPGSREIELIPGIEDLRIIGSAEDSTGFYVFTSEPSRVFRLVGDPLDGRWESVAGPYDGRIDQMMVLDDGSLLVFDETRDHISLRRFR